MAAKPAKPKSNLRKARRRPAAASRGGGCLETLLGAGCASLMLAGAALSGLAALGFAGLAYAYQTHIVDNPGPGFDEANIKSVIAQESPVYYRDGVTRIGVFFEDEHREYLAFEDIPVDWAVAIVAAEDGRFWTHRGVDPKHVVRALVADVVAGHVVAGGSTLSQQTAKNLFYRPDRSLKSKVDELANALRLEAHFDKPHILEFYANQFHVSGNGRGLGIAARYFFDIEAEDLDLLQAAYIAGLVKGPTNYDPFLGDTSQREKAKARAKDRVRYVLERIVAEDADNLAGPFPERRATVDHLKDEARRYLDQGFELKFKQGTFRYDKNAVVDEVARRLAEEPYKSVLADAGVDDPATAGLVVTTTLDADAQREAIYGLWHTLTEVGAMLEAPTAKDFVVAQEAPHADSDRRLVRHGFELARVKAHAGENGAKTLVLDLGGIEGVVDRDALTRVALVAYRGERKDKNAKISGVTVDSFAAAIPDGSTVFVSIRDLDPGQPAACDLELRPTLQGSAVVLQDGEIRAMVGGNDNRDYNRARAVRQMGSTWKPVTFHTALALGWSPASPLQNQLDVYPFQRVFYWPTEDHKTAPYVSMAWAGVNSENLATVWLLAHLTDVLDDAGTRRLAGQVELGPAIGEDPASYRRRLQQLGVAPGAGAKAEAAYLYARHEVLEGALTHPEDALVLEATPYGTGFDAERARVGRERSKEKDAKLAILERTWDHVDARVDPCTQQYHALEAALAAGQAPTETPDLSVHSEGDVVKVACGPVPEGFVPPSEASLAGILATRRVAAVAPSPRPADGRPTTIADHQKKRGKKGRQAATEPPPETEKWSSDAPTWSPDTPATPAPSTPPAAAVDAGTGTRLAALDDVEISGLHLSTIAEVRAAVAQRAGVLASVDPMDAAVLMWTQDFRTLLGIRAVVRTARAYGVRSQLAEVLPLTLGASEITLEEAASMYSGLTTGSAWDLVGRSWEGRTRAPDAPTTLIAKIADVDGNVLYEARPEPRVVAGPAVASMTDDILRNVVRYGTARRGDGAIVHGKAAIPIGGKTGTTNDYKNSAFLGYAPGASGSGYAVDRGYTVGVYIGYDDNRPMDQGNIEMAGATGALPAWLWTVRGLEDAGLLGKPQGKPTGAAWPLATAEGLVRMPADPSTGLAHAGSATAAEPGILTTPIALDRLAPAVAAAP